MKKIQSALISVYYKDGLESIVNVLHQLGITIYSTGGTQKFIEELGVNVVPVESLTQYPSILGGRVKTLHPSVFGGILGRRSLESDLNEMVQYSIPEIDLVIVDLYPFEETVASTQDEKLIIEKIDIGGPSMLRGAAKNFQDVVVLSNKNQYEGFANLLTEQAGNTTLAQRRSFAIAAFDVCAAYDLAISNYFHQKSYPGIYNTSEKVLRYGENPHQEGSFYGSLEQLFTQLHGKELSYNNLMDVDGAMQLAADWSQTTEAIFAVIKHTNVCGMAQCSTLPMAWNAALAGDPESAFGGILISNQPIDEVTATSISDIFFEVLIAPGFSGPAMSILQTKKNRILLKQIKSLNKQQSHNFKSVLNGVLSQTGDEGNCIDMKQVGGREAGFNELEDMIFANIICKHLKSNAITLVKNKQMIGKGCGQTSRIDALRQAIEKANQFKFDLNGAVMASDAFFPFDDCVKLGHKAGINAFIQPGGSVRDNDSILYCKNNNLAMVFTQMRHFKH